GRPPRDRGAGDPDPEAPLAGRRLEESPFMASVVAWIGFLACAAAVAWSGSHLARLGDRLAALTGLGRAWLGLVLMATVTSLPELFVGIGSAGVQGNADL